MRFKKCIDIGCGNGFLTSFFVDCCDEVHGVDKDEELIKECRRRMPQGDFKVFDLDKEILTGEYDLVIFSDVIYYLHKQKEIVEAIANILVDRGLLITSRHLRAMEIVPESPFFERVKHEHIWDWDLDLWRRIDRKKVA